MKYRVCTYGNPVLREKGAAITAIDESIRALADDMLQVMVENNGAGLAAQQIGKQIQLCAVNFDPIYDVAETHGDRQNPHVVMPLVLINPILIRKTGSQTAPESCLSIPGISAPVERAFEIAVSFQNLNGEKQQLVVKGYMARVIQHEMDHLNGMLFVDRISTVKKVSLSGKLRRLKKKTEAQLCTSQQL